MVPGMSQMQQPGQAQGMVPGMAQMQQPGQSQGMVPGMAQMQQPGQAQGMVPGMSQMQPQMGGNMMQPTPNQVTPPSTLTSTLNSADSRLAFDFVGHYFVCFGDWFYSIPCWNWLLITIY